MLKTLDFALSEMRGHWNGISIDEAFDFHFKIIILTSMERRDYGGQGWKHEAVAIVQGDVG